MRDDMLHSEDSWERVSGWKASITLVDRADLAECIDSALFVDPLDGLRGVHDDWWEAWTQHRQIRVADDAVARRLHEAGVPTWSIGYHRGVDVLGIHREGPSGNDPAEVFVGALWGFMDLEDTEREDDVIDALLRIHSDGAVTEAAVLLAAASPPLRLREDADRSEGADRSHLPALRLLPDVSDAFVSEVAQTLAIAEEQAASRPPPAEPTEARRRGYQRQAFIASTVGVGLALCGIWVPVLVVPVGVLITMGALVWLLYEAQRQRRDGTQSGSG